MEHAVAIPQILLAEDSPTQAERLRWVLERSGLAVTLARNGDEALVRIAASRPALVVSDVMMPGMDGYELCRQIRQDPLTAEIPVVLLTALSEASDVMRGLSAGASDFVAKAAGEASLVARINRVLSQRDLSRSTPDGAGIEVWFAGDRYMLESDPSQAIGFLLSTFEDALENNARLNEANSELRTAVRKISVLETRYKKLMEFTPTALLVVGHDGVIWFANQAAETLFQRPADELKGQPFPFPLVPGQVTEVEMSLGKGEVATVDCRVVETTWGDGEARLVSLWDVTENVRLRRQMQELSVTDELTGLSNRRGFMILAEQQHKLVTRGHSVVLVYMDLDDFKIINDTLGHAAGDAALIEAGQLLRLCVRDSDLLARVGGDEFAALLIDATPSFLDGAVRRIKRIFNQRNERLRGNGIGDLSISVGAVLYTGDDSVSLDELIAAADQLMYKDKQETKAARASARA
jgi:diguanylate cyclase (GGDEF)-like protein